jgi:cytochrome c553
MTRNWAMLAAAVLLAAGTSTLAAADAANGKRLFDSTCAACHGRNGIGIIPLYPNLAGQKREYLVAQLRAFRDDSRKNPIMSPMAVHLTDAEIEDVSTYIASLK